MEKKTFGSFLQALRKANGMTQQDLADKLGVSNKAVSRWERDENYPDLTLLPAIAEIFDVTTDELLGGGKKPAREYEASEEQLQNEAKAEKKKTEKQVKILLKKKENQWIRNVAICGAIFAACALLFIIFWDNRIFYIPKAGPIIKAIVLFLLIASFIVFAATPIIETLKFRAYVYSFEDCDTEIKKSKKKFFIISWILTSIIVPIALITYTSAAGLDLIYSIIISLFLEVMALLILQIIKKNVRASIALAVDAAVLICFFILFHDTSVDTSKIFDMAKTQEFTSIEEFEKYVESNPNPHVPTDPFVTIYIPDYSVYYQGVFADGTHSNIIQQEHVESGEPYYANYYALYTLKDSAGSETFTSFALKNEDVYAIKFVEKDGKITVLVCTEEAYYSALRLYSVLLGVLDVVLAIIAIVAPIIGFTGKKKS